MKKKIENTEIVSEPKVYELGALFVPELGSEALNQAIASLKGKLSDLGATIISEGESVYLKLAYTIEKSIKNKIKKVSHAHFYSVKFEVDPSMIAELKKALDLQYEETIIRYLITKTVRENTQLTQLTAAVELKEEKDNELIAEVEASVGEEAVDAITDTESKEEAVAEVETPVEEETTKE